MAKAKTKTSNPKAKRKKRITPLTGMTESGDLLTEKEESFCRHYVREKGNGTQAIINAYSLDAKKRNMRNTASTMARDLLRLPKIIERLQEIQSIRKLDDDVADMELAWTATQRAELGPKIQSLNTYYKIKGKLKDTVEIVLPAERKKAIQDALKDL